MRVMFDVPDDTVCAVFNCVKGDSAGLTLYTRTLDTKELNERSVIYVGEIIERDEVNFNNGH